mmetsp:Transcript_18335/g.33461  ORF Transcript_18335/g.33461 Transcript_18335/m.33461 type:complete len:384 (-) Transcript_18335:88-1239(-)
MSRPLGTSCSIFVGNVPYDAQEDELRELFSKAGPVTSVRLVHDKDTRQPKGYAFCDFADPSLVRDAIEKLNNIEYNGRRLRVDWAERELNHTTGPKALEDHRVGGGPPPRPGGPPPGIDPLGAPPPPVTTVADRLARIREAEDAEKARVAAADAAERAEIARLVETMTPAQLFHILGEMQRLTLRAPEVARALIGENLQLCLALQHAQFLVGLVDQPPLPTDPGVHERARSVREKVFKAAPAPPTANGGPALGVPSQPLPPHQAALGLATLTGLPHGLAGVPAGLTAAGLPGGFPGAPMALGGLPAPSFPAAPMGPIDLTGNGPLPAAPGIAPGLPGVPAPPGPASPLLERLVQLTPAEIDQLPHHSKVQLLEYLQKLQPQAA